MSKRTATLPMNKFPTSLAPAGAVSSKCCPKMAGMQRWWSGAGPVTASAQNRCGGTIDTTPTSNPTTFGFDIVTNLPNLNDRGRDEYWNRSGAPGTSGGRRDLDGSTWVCVGVGKTADVEIRFVGQAGQPCIGNVTIEVDVPAKATATPATFGADSAKLTITGAAEGECTVTAMCNGKPLGWCHVAVYNPGVATVKVWRVNLKDAAGVDLTSNTAISAADITLVLNNLNDVYGQCAVSWSVQNGGTISYTTPASVGFYNATLAVNTSPNDEFFAEIMAQHTPSPAPTIDLYYFEPLVFTPPATGYHDSGGIANGIPSRQCLVYAPIASNWGKSLLPHELGHCLGLFHPSDPSSAAAQLPDNFRNPLVTGGYHPNVMYSDHTNLMGYGAGPPPDSGLRYGQWVAVQSTV